MLFNQSEVKILNIIKINLIYIYMLYNIVFLLKCRFYQKRWS